jgi:ankyrin repeat protein
VLKNSWKKGANIRVRNNHQDTPLTKSIRQGNLGAVTLLLQKLGVEDIHQQDNKGITAVHEAAMWGQHEMLNLLIEKGGNVNIQDFEGNSPLYLACDKSIIGNRHFLQIC